MKCEECGYAEWDEYGTIYICRYPYDDGYAPCEIADDYEEPEYDEWD